MLKIKDNVDLKELEKYGFEYDKDRGFYWKYVFLSRYGDEKQYWVDEETRIIYFQLDKCGLSIFEYDNTLYDLIKDDLVEKVEK